MKLTNLLCAVALAVPAVAYAEPLSELDTSVVAHQHVVNQTEIEMGKLAQANSSSAGVKKYGAMLVKDHTAADTKLTTFAKGKGLAAIPADSSQTDADKKDMADMKAKLKAEHGADFDRDFLDMMAGAHQKELVKIDADIGVVGDKTLVAMLKNIKPVLQTHADTAASLKSGATSSNP
ncbi:MAG: DUF4142 domain-containing protein [Kofleriaceae bacterium]